MIVFRTKIFIRYPQTLFKTEDAFQLKKHDIAAIIQSRWKGRQQRKKYLKLRECTIGIQSYIRRYLAKKEMERRRWAAQVIRRYFFSIIISGFLFCILCRFIKGFITRNGQPTEENRAFLNMAKVEWLKRLAKSLPTRILNRVWPPCPYVCREASAHLERMHAAHLSRVYRLKLTPEMKRQFELKILAEKIFKGN